MFDIFAGWALVLWIIGVLLIILAIYCFFQADGAGISLILGVAAIIWGFAIQSDHKATQFAHLSPQEACHSENARAVPSVATLSTIKDDRVGLIYPCYYLLDHGIEPGMDGVIEPVPMRLQGGVNESLFADQNFTAEGDLGGIMLLGTGYIDGSYDAKQTTERKQVVAFMAETSDGYASFVVESGSVRYKECDADCTPSVSIWTSEEPLYTKLADDSKDKSIWRMGGGQTHVAALTRNGTPGSPGQTVQALATRIVVELPDSLMPGASSLSSN